MAHTQAATDVHNSHSQTLTWLTYPGEGWRRSLGEAALPDCVWKIQSILDLTNCRPRTSRLWLWWWCSTRRWSPPARWRWRGRPGSCRPATATPPWSLSSTGCRNLTRGSEGPVTVSPTNLPLVSWRSKKNRIGTENTILVNQADNTSHFALLSETKEKFYHCKFVEVAMTGEWLCLSLYSQLLLNLMGWVMASYLSTLRATST